MLKTLTVQKQRMKGGSRALGQLQGRRSLSFEFMIRIKGLGRNFRKKKILIGRHFVSYFKTTLHGQRKTEV